ncbi:MAG TPA: aminoglycoside phosphotransferase family protein [Solirubrobacteraceae bacterium]|nr:aminoglycoside phosphotransferase family protein [Solirubrobacteraceae bacterium]
MEVTLERRALEAARAIAATGGVACEQAVVAYSGSNVLVHLRPAPVVARVMTGTVVLHDDPQRWLEREVTVLEFLAPTGLAVSPSPLIAPGPYQHDGLWMTFAEWLPGVEPASPPADAARLGRALRTLHDELRPFDGELGTLRDLRDDIVRLLALLRPSQSLDARAISSLHERLDAAGDLAFNSALPAQTLHGDASLHNLLRAPGRLVWNDFEDTFRGPVHWDVAGFTMSLRSRGATPAFVRRVLEHYGWGDEQELAPFVAAHEVYDAIWRLYDRQRRAGAPAG